MKTVWKINSYKNYDFQVKNVNQIIYKTETVECTKN